MKIALVNWYSTAEGVKGGCEIIDDDLKTVLEKQGHEVELITFRKAATALQRPMYTDYQRYTVVDRAYLISDYLEQREKLFGDIDLIISQDCCLAFSNLKKTKLWSYTNNPYQESGKISSVAAFAGMAGHLFYNEFGRFYPFLQRLQVSKSSLNIVPSQYMRRYCEKLGMGVDEVIPHAVDTDLFKPLPKGETRARLGIPEDARVGMANTAVHPVKGWNMLAELIRRRQDITWLIVLKHQVPRRPKLKNVHLFTRVPRERLPELYSAADFLVNPSYVESFGLAPLEAMACGVPAIVSRSGFVWHLKEEFAEAGQIVDRYGDVQGYNQAVDKVFEREWHPRRWVLEHGYDFGTWAERWRKPLIEA